MNDPATPDQKAIDLTATSDPGHRPGPRAHAGDIDVKPLGASAGESAPRISIRLDFAWPGRGPADTGGDAGDQPQPGTPLWFVLAGVALGGVWHHRESLPLDMVTLALALLTAAFVGVSSGRWTRAGHDQPDPARLAPVIPRRRVGEHGPAPRHTGEVSADRADPTR